MPGDLDVTVNFETGGGAAPDWLRQIGQLDANWTRQTSPFAGTAIATDAPPGSTFSHAVEIPIYFTQPGAPPRIRGLEGAQPSEAESVGVTEPTEAAVVATPEPQSAESVSLPSAEAAGGGETGGGEEAMAPSAAEAVPSETPTAEIPSTISAEAPTIIAPEPTAATIEPEPAAAEIAPEPAAATVTPEPAAAEIEPTPSAVSPEAVAAPQPASAEAEPLPGPAVLPEFQLPTAEQAETQPSEEVPEAKPEPILVVPQPDYPALTEATWFAGVAMFGGDKRYTFWDGYHQDGGLNFGYDETDGTPSGHVQAVLGEDMGAALGAGTFGFASDGTGPGSYGIVGSGTVTVNVSLNNQSPNIHAEPDAYEPVRDGSGPIRFPSGSGCAGIAVISIPSTSDPNAVVLPPTWWMITSRLQGTVAGLLCAGTIPSSGTGLTFTSDAEIAVAVIALLNCHGSVVPKQLNSFQGHLDAPASIELTVTPLQPYPWPATQVTQQKAIADFRR